MRMKKMEIICLESQVWSECEEKKGNEDMFLCAAEAGGETETD